jgi:multidrug efflux pump subunit AcrA (membrane-fusion protein)
MPKASLTLVVLASVLMTSCAGIGQAQPTPIPQLVASPTAQQSPFTNNPLPDSTSANVEPTTTPVPTIAVQRGTVVDELLLNGQIGESRQRELAMTTAGTIDKLFVTGPTQIRRGQLLAELELAELPDQLRRAQADAEQAQQTLSRVAQEREIAVRRAQLDLETAQLKLKRLQQPPEPLAIARAEADLDLAKADLERIRNDASATKSNAELALDLAVVQLVQAQQEFEAARLEFERAQKGRDERALANAEARLRTAREKLTQAEDLVKRAQVALDTARNNEVASVRSAEARVVLAQRALDDLSKPPKSVDIEQAQIEIRTAQLAIEAARTQNRAGPEVESRLRTSQADIARIQEEIESRRLYAPFDGDVVSILVAEGATLRANEAIMIATDAGIPATDLQVVASSTDINAARISLGQPATIIFSRYPDQEFPGRVIRIPVVPPGTAASVGAAPANYIFSYDAPNIALAVGDAAEVIITLGRKENALWLPPSAVSFDANNRPFVTVPDGDRTRRVSIRVGFIGPERIEIQQGLSEGDLVIIR